MERDKEEKKRNLNTVEHSIEKKKEKNEHFLEIWTVHRSKKKKESWTFVNSDCFDLLTSGENLCKKRKSLFEFKGDIR